MMDSSECHIDKLPNDLLLDIFLKVSPRLEFPYSDRLLLSPIGSVCQRWRDLVFSPKLWREVEIYFNDEFQPNADFYANFHLVAPAIHILEISNKAYPASRILTKFPYFPNVKQLTFNVGPYLSPMELDLMVELFPLVQTFAIDVDCYHLNDTTLQLLAAGWPKLVEIQIWRSRTITAAGFIRFVTVANRLQSLRISEIRDITDRDVDVITRLLGKTLKSINIGMHRDNLSGLAIESIAQNCPLLETIYVEKPMHIGPLKHLANLKSLAVIFANNVDVRTGFDEYFRRPLGQLRELNISGATKLTDSHLTQIAISCPLLESLSLRVPYEKFNQSVTDAGLDEIIDGCNYLTQLELIGFECLTYRSFTRGKLSRLTSLTLLRCRNLGETTIRAEFSGVESLSIRVEKY